MIEQAGISPGTIYPPRSFFPRPLRVVDLQGPLCFVRSPGGFVHSFALRLSLGALLSDSSDGSIGGVFLQSSVNKPSDLALHLCASIRSPFFHLPSTRNLIATKKKTKVVVNSNGKNIDHTVDAAANGKAPLKIKVQKGAKYLLKGEDGFAPENVTLTRVGARQRRRPSCRLRRCA